MIFRIWHGWTTVENSDIYENLLKKEIFPAIASKNVSGYRGIQLLRRQLSNEAEFITIMQFDSLEAVKQFAGEDYEKSYLSMLDEKGALDLQEAFIDGGFVPAKKGPLLALPSVEC